MRSRRRVPPSRGCCRWSLHHANVDSNEVVRRTSEAIERRVFREDLDYDDELWTSEYPRFDDRSVWTLLLFHDPLTGQAQPAGALRAVVGPVRELKFSEHLEQLWGTNWDDAARTQGLDPNARVLECATISVLPEFRTIDNRWPVKALCAAFGHLVLDLGCDYAVQVQDVAGIRLLNTLLRVPFDVFAGLEPVDFNGPVQPSITHISEHHNLIKPSRDPGFASLYLDRNEMCRGGTILPPIDLTETGPLALHQRLLASEGVLAAHR